MLAAFGTSAGERTLAHYRALLAQADLQVSAQMGLNLNALKPLVRITVGARPTYEKPLLCAGGNASKLSTSVSRQEEARSTCGRRIVSGPTFG